MARTVNSAGFFRALFGRLGIALVLCAALVAVGVFWVNQYIDEEIDRIPRVALATSTTENNGVNFLIIGSDSREFVAAEGGATEENFGDVDDAGPPKSDTLMVLHANGDRSFAVSFPRDTWVTIPGRGDMKINAAFNDGPQAVVDTLAQNFNIGINHYLEVDFRSFEGLVDAIGGVPVYFEYTTKDEFTGLLIPFPNTCYQLDGGQSLAYVRSRSPQYFIDGRWQDASGRADLDRIERQQEFVKRLGRIAIDKTTDDPRLAPDIADEVIPNLQADEGFDRNAFNQLARALMSLSAGHATSLEFATLPAIEGRRDGQSVLLVDQPAADEMLARLRGDVVPEPGPTPTEGDADAGSDALAPSDVRVTVRNGSDVSGAAATALQDLGNRGFVRGRAENDTRGTVARTEVRHRAGNEAAAQLVASYVEGGAELVADSTLAGDVVLVIGSGFGGIASAPAAPADGGGATAAPFSPEAACQ
jgi:LCP family protein required for cell wall assembly